MVIYLSLMLPSGSSCLPNLALHQLEFTSFFLSPGKRVNSLVHDFTLIPKGRHIFCCTCPLQQFTLPKGRRYRLTTLSTLLAVVLIGPITVFGLSSLSFNQSDHPYLQSQIIITYKSKKINKLRTF